MPDTPCRAPSEPLDDEAWGREYLKFRTSLKKLQARRATEPPPRTPVLLPAVHLEAIFDDLPEPQPSPDPRQSTLFDCFPRGDFQEALYRVSQKAGPGGTEIDSLLDAHRLTYGDPEQVAYAFKPCHLDGRRNPNAQVPDGPLRWYFKKHDRWNT